VQILAKTQTELPHKDRAVAKGVNSWLPKPFGASTNQAFRSHAVQDSNTGKFIVDKSGS
jgi:hypothetical protein